MKSELNDYDPIQFLGTDRDVPDAVRVNIKGEVLHAFSKSAHYTFFIFKKHKIAFDLGFCPIEAVACQYVFLTHAHEDHSWGLIRHIQYRRLFNLKPARYFMPFELVESFQEVLAAWNRFNQRENWELPCIVGVKDQQILDLAPNLRVVPFLTHHRGFSLGFHWFKSKTDDSRPFFSYLGDHTVKSLIENPLLGTSRVLAMELTFLEGEEEKAQKYQHMHLNDFINLAGMGFFQNELLILKHISSKYPQKKVKDILASAAGSLPLPTLCVI